MTSHYCVVYWEDKISAPNNVCPFSKLVENGRVMTSTSIPFYSGTSLTFSWVEIEDTKLSRRKIIQSQIVVMLRFCDISTMVIDILVLCVLIFLQSSRCIWWCMSSSKLLLNRITLAQHLYERSKIRQNQYDWVKEVSKNQLFLQKMTIEEYEWSK